MLNVTARVAGKTQDFCLKILPKNTTYPEAFEAILCGKNPENSKNKQGLSSAGMIHLFVVSGSHIVALLWLLSKLQISRLFSSLILLTFVLMTGAQPPAVRGFTGVLLNRHMPADLRTLKSGAILLCLFPTWITSVSFWLSWIFSLCQNLPQWWVYICVIPFLWGWGCLHPISVIYNLVLGPIAGLILLPLLALNVLIPQLTILSDSAISIFYFLCNQSLEIVEIQNQASVDQWILCLYVCCLHGIFHFLRVQKLRNPHTFNRNQ